MLYGAGSLLATYGQESSSNPPVLFSEIEQKTITFPDYLLVLHRVKPPILPRTPIVSKSATPTSADLAANKDDVALTIFVTVFVGEQTISEIRWRDADTAREFRAYSNVDFRYLTSTHRIQGDNAVYIWAPIITICDVAALSSDEKLSVPVNLNFSEKGAEYFVEARQQDLARQKTMLAGLDHLHAYYQLHHEHLKATYEKLQADNKARAEAALKRPITPPTFSLWYWTSY